MGIYNLISLICVLHWLAILGALYPERYMSFVIVFQLKHDNNSICDNGCGFIAPCYVDINEYQSALNNIISSTK